jgi:hypothetical protein
MTTRSLALPYVSVVLLWLTGVVATNILNDQLKLHRTGFHADFGLTILAALAFFIEYPLVIFVNARIKTRLLRIVLFAVVFLLPGPIVAWCVN